MDNKSLGALLIVLIVVLLYFSGALSKQAFMAGGKGSYCAGKPVTVQEWTLANTWNRGDYNFPPKCKTDATCAVYVKNIVKDQDNKVLIDTAFKSVTIQPSSSEHIYDFTFNVPESATYLYVQSVYANDIGNGFSYKQSEFWATPEACETCSEGQKKCGPLEVILTCTANKVYNNLGLTCEFGCTGAVGSASCKSSGYSGAHCAGSTYKVYSSDGTKTLTSGICGANEKCNEGASIGSVCTALPSQDGAINPNTGLSGPGTFGGINVSDAEKKLTEAKEKNDWGTLALYAAGGIAAALIAAAILQKLTGR